MSACVFELCVYKYICMYVCVYVRLYVRVKVCLQGDEGGGKSLWQTSRQFVVAQRAAKRETSRDGTHELSEEGQMYERRRHSQFDSSWPTFFYYFFLVLLWGGFKALIERYGRLHLFGETESDGTQF